MYCTKCGKELAKDARFCTYCGAKVQQEEYPGNNKGFNGGYEEKKRAVQELFGFERSSQWIMALLQFGKIFLLIFVFGGGYFILESLFSPELFGIVFSAIYFFIAVTMESVCCEALNELKREYNFHGQVVVNASDSTNIFINAITEGFSRILSALATKMEHKKSVKTMSDEEWLEYYIELKSSFSHTDHARHFEDYTKRSDANWQMQQQQFQRQAQEFQQQQCQQQEEMNRQMQEFQRQQEMDQQMQQQQFQQQIMSQQMQDQALQQQLLDQQQQMQQMNDNMLH